ncbi:MAG: recombination regulator RecX [Burkholderiaceae bacterium]|nr:recombination regulator RecX [Burkholderiaceae bacterium]
MPEQPSSLKARALRYLALREHSRAELERKLAPQVAGDTARQTELARALDELTAKGFISEIRVVESTLHARAGKLGSARVLHELRRKGIGDAALTDAAEALRDTEFDRARAVWEKKFGADPAPATLGNHAEAVKARARQLRFLAARGFSGDIARRVVRGDEDEGC